MAKKKPGERKIRRHCQKAFVSRARGLCWFCSKDPAIRDLYPAKIIASASHGATPEELEAMIEQRSKDMPERQRGG